MEHDPTGETPALDHAGKPQDPKYGDFLLVDILHPDFRHFLSRYRTDLLGFIIVSALIAFIIVGTKWLAMIGSDAAVRMGAG
jgi:hypothetical protein